MFIGHHVESSGNLTNADEDNIDASSRVPCATFESGITSGVSRPPGDDDDTVNTSPTETMQRPCFRTYDEAFSLHGKLFKPGLYYHAYQGKQKQESRDVWICSPIHILAKTYQEHNASWGLLLRFRDLEGYWCEWALPRQLMAGHGEEWRSLLLAKGVVMDKSQASLLLDWLHAAQPEKKIILISCTGWYQQEDKRVFVLPHRIIGSHTLHFQSEHVADHDYGSKGTLKGWQMSVAAYCQDNPMLLFAVSCAFVGPLLKLVNHNAGGFGIHLQGDSSQGKTTALRMAASVWGASSFVKSWNATHNGMQGIAAALNDTLLVLDEISESDPHVIGSVTYALSNGVGKQRASRKGEAKPLAKWRIVWLSSGERSLEGHMREANLEAKAGQQVRLLNIPATQRSFGIFDSLHGHASGSLFASALNQAYEQHYGHAGVAFIEHLLADQQDFNILYANTINLPTFSAKEGLDSRAAKAFALIAMAGELAITYGIVPWQPNDALQAASELYHMWCNQDNNGYTEDRQILKIVQAFIDKYGENRFYPLYPEQALPPKVYGRAGYWKMNDAGRVYCFFPSALEEIVKGFDKGRIAQALERAGWLIERDRDKRTKKMIVPEGMKKGLYVVQPKDEDSY